MRRNARSAIRLLVAVFLPVFLSPVVAHANDVADHLDAPYRGKIFVQRTFYSGPRLQYDSAGTVASGGSVGDWTTDAFVQLNDIHLSDHKLEIRATRLMVICAGRNGFQLAATTSPKKHKDSKKAAIAEIEVPATSEESARALLSKIFLGAQDSIVDYVPEFWKACVEEGLSGKNANCRFSAEMLTVPGMTIPGAHSSSPIDPQLPVNSPGSAATTTVSGGLFRVGHGVKPPKVIYQPEPSFSDAARNARYEGTLTMGLIVDKDGLPKKIHVMHPLGAGLDAKAVQAVETWRFAPATKDGRPVPVVIAVEVYFHLY